MSPPSSIHVRHLDHHLDRTLASRVEEAASERWTRQNTRREAVPSSITLRTVRVPRAIPVNDEDNEAPPPLVVATKLDSSTIDFRNHRVVLALLVAAFVGLAVGLGMSLSSNNNPANPSPPTTRTQEEEGEIFSEVSGPAPYPPLVPEPTPQPTSETTNQQLGSNYQLPTSPKTLASLTPSPGSSNNVPYSSPSPTTPSLGHISFSAILSRPTISPTLSADTKKQQTTTRSPTSSTTTPSSAAGMLSTDTSSSPTAISPVVVGTSTAWQPTQTNVLPPEDQSPAAAGLAELTDKISSVTPWDTSGLIIGDVLTAQHASALWILDDPDFDAYTDEVIVARYALDVMYRSMGGIDNEWDLADGWHRYGIDHCGFVGVVCNVDGEVILFNMTDFGLGGEIPMEIGLFPRLRAIKMDGNDIRGSIPTSIGLLMSLRELVIHNNNLGGNIPTEMGNLADTLGRLQLYDNSLDGSIPTELGLLAKLFELSIDGNMLLGTIPTELGNLVDCNFLYLNKNLLEGTIPSELGSLGTVFDFILSDNVLTGSIPDLLFHEMQKDVRYVNLGENRLTGTVPTNVGRLRGINTRVLLHKNLLEGKIPTEVGTMETTVELRLDENLMTGQIPTEIGNMASIVQLRLDGYNDDNGPKNTGNNFTGMLPTEISRLLTLEYLYVRQNSLNGPIPTELGNCTSLQALYLYNNLFTGKVPSELGSLQNLTKLYLDGNDLVGEIPEEICALRDNGLLGNLTADCNEVECSCCSECY